MSLQQFRASGFRCLEPTLLQPDSRLNIITGPNASGKTSLLEAMFYLGRGRSFRNAGNRELIRTDTSGFTLFGETVSRETTHKLGVEVAIGERKVRVDGENGSGGDLARILPVQAIDPEVHELVQGGPEYRRRFLDWGVFHVEHDFLDVWRRFQKALRQRNAALRQKEPDSQVQVWDDELVEQGERVDQCRSTFIETYLPLFDDIIGEKVPFDAICNYKRGWSSKTNLREALAESWARDRSYGSTQVGPHRADLQIQVQDRRARHRVSRGQQKLLAAAMVITQVRHVANLTDNELLLLVDDPAAELDRENRERLFQLLQDMPAQMFVTALEAGDLPPSEALSETSKSFHVEHGKVSALV
ncbi:MAG: DNA replication/repair protein RecF [Gammaproteobacteria bacterium]